MSMVVFFRYLLSHEPTAELATQLADVYTARARIAQQRAALGGSAR